LLTYYSSAGLPGERFRTLKIQMKREPSGASSTWALCAKNDKLSSYSFNMLEFFFDLCNQAGDEFDKEHT
jgi:hypothetical protein